MGQQEVYDCLKRNKKKWLSSKEIVKDLKRSPSSVLGCLKRLRDSKMVNFKLDKKPLDNMSKRKIYLYGHKE